MFCVGISDDVNDHIIPLQFNTCDPQKCVEFAQYNELISYTEFNFSLIDVGELDSRIQVDEERVAEVKVLKSMSNH